ncbi:HET-domain-containing protein, partial [Rhizodiscina lignyota]
MHLLEVFPNGEFRLTPKFLDAIPRYAILSHTWGHESQEVTYQDIVEGSGQDKDGYKKIKFCGEQATKDDLKYIWVDSCCIDKLSSAVLSESINSMFRWYKNAAKCYVYMADVSTNKRKLGDEDALKTWEQTFRKSRWFTRGWTLQELLAPTIVEFFSSDGKELGSRETLKEQIHEITGISFQALEGSPIHVLSVSERRSWTEGRVTTLPEDGAYCLMGLFDVSMATRYGEGREKAFERLDNKIKKANMASNDQKPAGNRDAAEKREAISRWLSPPDPSTNYQKGLRLRQADTGLWFLEREQYTTWRASPSSFIWLYGIPGCGKTVLSSTVIEDVLQHCENDPGKAAAYFYFDFNDLQKQSSELMTKSLVTQLSQQCIRIPPLLDSLFSSSNNGQRQPSIEALLDALRQMSEELPATYIILDALDECADREELMSTIETIASWQLESLHVIVTSRKEPDIENSLESFVDTCNIIPLQRTVVDEDIRKYVRHRISVDKKLKKWRSGEMQKEIEVALMEGAHGMFRWAVCQLDSLGNCVSRAMLRKSLRRLPPTLDETYERILCAIHEDHSTQALRILQWLAFSLRPLSLEEIAEVVAVDPESVPALDEDEILEDPLDALDICASLVTISSQNNGEPEYESDYESDDETETDASEAKRVIALAHYSVKEYLTSDRIREGPAKIYSLQESTSHVFIANSCIGYLLQFQDAESFCTETIETHKLAEYSAGLWIDHTRSYASGEDSTQKLVMKLFSVRDGAFLNWIRIFNLEFPWMNNDIERQADDVASPLYYASLAGLMESVRCLLRDANPDASADVNAQGGEYGNALQAASYNGCEAAVKLLLDSGADVNAQGGVHSNALQAASFRGHEAVVKLLLDSGADVNAQGGYY